MNNAINRQPQHFEMGQLPKVNQALSRDTESRQVMKICYSCGKGFCKRKGREKAGIVANRPGRYVCLQCEKAVLAGKCNRLITLNEFNPSCIKPL